MILKIYNSLTQKKEEFTPLEKGAVKMYVCGPTVYDEPHIGHLRSAYAFEVMRNYFKSSGYKVNFVRNVTDVDDKIIEKAHRTGESTTAVAQKYLKMYKEDLKKLGILDPDHEPKATEHIPAMIRMIEELIEKKNAYASNGDVYFDVASFPQYGEVSHQQTDKLEGEEKDANKKGPLDFALWKKAKDGEPSWDSPWGQGRPGWHIECSAMSLAYFKGTFDIHGGGRDLIFPHHENENAQSRCALGQKFVNTWVHHGLITISGKKMSKSLKNFIALGSLIDEDSFGKVYAAEVLKLTFLGTHYSAPLDYTPERVQMDRQIWKKFMEFFENARVAEKNGARESEKRLPEFYKPFREAMDNDFNTPEVLTLMQNLMRDTYKENDPVALVTAAKAIRIFGFDVLGIIFENVGTHGQKIEIEAQIALRKQAREQKDYKPADEIRERLLREKHIELRDLPDGRTTYRPKL